MAERTSGLYKLVTLPGIYEFIQNLLGGERARASFARDFFGDLSDKRVLEVGCGPGTWFPDVWPCREYLGMDWNEEHIQEANKRYGTDSVSFVCGDVAKDVKSEFGSFDVILALGILHHLDDGQAASLVGTCRQLLAENGRLISIDPVYHDGQHWFAKWMCDRDSGQDIRQEVGYQSITEPFFTSVETRIETSRLRIPYSHVVMISQN